VRCVVRFHGCLSARAMGLASWLMAELDAYGTCQLHIIEAQLLLVAIDNDFVS
jgi:hypothetical protein